MSLTQPGHPLYFLALCLAVLIASFKPLYAQSSESVAVLDLEARGISSIEAASLTDRLRTDLVLTQAVAVVERGQMEQILLEQDFQMTGCTSNECAVEVGQLLGVTTMVAGSIGRVGSTFTIDIRTIDVGSGRITGSLKRDFRGEIDGLLDIMTDIANELAGTAMVVSAPPESVPRVATMAVESQPPGAAILLDGDAIGITPLDEAEIEPDRPHNLTVSLSGYEQLDTTFIAQTGRHLDFQFPMEPIVGWLTVRSQPTQASVMVDGELVGRTPIAMRMVAPDTLHSVSLSLNGYQSIDTSLFAELGIHHELDVPLLRICMLSISTHPSGTTIQVDGKVVGVTPIRQLEVAPNSHHIVSITHDGYQPIDSTLSAGAGQHYQWDVSLKQLTNWLSIQGDAGSRVIIDGQYYGKLPLDRVLLPTGEHNLLIRKAEYYPHSDKVLITQEQEAAVNFSLRKKPKLPALVLSTAIPGSGQLYQGYTGKGILFLIGAIGAAYYSYDCQAKFIEDYDLFKTRRTEYRNAEELDDIEAAKILMEESYNTMKESERLRDMMFGVLGGAWVINILDVTF